MIERTDRVRRRLRGGSERSDAFAWAADHDRVGLRPEDSVLRALGLHLALEWGGRHPGLEPGCGAFDGSRASLRRHRIAFCGRRTCLGRQSHRIPGAARAIDWLACRITASPVSRTNGRIGARISRCLHQATGLMHFVSRLSHACIARLHVHPDSRTRAPIGCACLRYRARRRRNGALRTRHAHDHRRNAHAGARW